MATPLRVSVSAALVAAASASANDLVQGSLVATSQGALEQAWSAELSDDSKNRSPVKRVVTLLTKMKAELETEAAGESDMYDKMVCWCKTNGKEKTAAVATADTTMQELETETEGRSARYGELSTSIEAMKKQIAEDTAALRKATAIREKEATGFRAEEADLVQAVTNLKNAINVLSKHHSNLLQMDAPAISGMQVVLRDVALKHEMLSVKSRRPRRASFVSLAASVRRDTGATELEESLSHLLSGDQQAVPADLPVKFAEKLLKRLSGAGASTSSDAFLQSAKQPIAESYSSRSEGIYGILNQMLEDFTSELSSSQQAEAAAVDDHSALAAAKNDQLTFGKAKLDEMETELAENTKALSDAKETLDLTRKQRSSDVEFLRNLKLQCNDLDSQWQTRSKTRSMETQAIAETIAILTEDENREQLAKGAPAFLQVGEHSSEHVDTQRALRARAVEALRAAARSPDFDASDLLTSWEGRSHAPVAPAGPRAQLATLATMVQLDSFTKVKEMMDKLVADMKAEQEEEVKFKAYCEKELKDNEKAVHDKTNEKKDLTSKIEHLDTLIEKLAAEIKDAKADIASTEVDVKKASQTREAENAAFQTTVADQRAIQSILKKALARLEDFYKKQPGAAAFAQRHAQTPPVQFNKYNANAGSSSVMGLIEQIIGDSSSLEKEAIKGEYASQADYEQMVKDSNAVIASLSEAVTEKTGLIAEAKEDKTAADSGLKSTNGELESLGQYEGDLHMQCDFVLNNFEIRQKARQQEMDAIATAKAILSGAQAE